MLTGAQPAFIRAAKFRSLPAKEHVQRGIVMRYNCHMSWKREPERVDLPIIITVLLASEETKVPEDKHSEDTICITGRLLSLCQRHDLA